MKFKMALCVAGMLSATMLFGTEEVQIPLWPKGKMPDRQQVQKYEPFLVWHTPSNRTTTAILIVVSGGGYKNCGIGGFEVAPKRDYMLAKGMTVVSMRYRTPRPVGLAKHVTAWQDAQRTVRLVRAEAKKRGLDPENIGFSGNSAGGHLTLLTAVSSQTPAYAPIDEIDKLPCHVNWAIPVYPAYVLADAMDVQNPNRGNDLAVGFAPELKFDAATPPMCFFHGDDDGWTPMGSVRAYHKLRTMGIPAELHIMALEQHCFMSNPRPGTFAADWLDTAWNWLVSMDIVTGHPQSWRTGWRPLLAAYGPKLESVADYDPTAWKCEGWGRAILTAEKDAPLWFKGKYTNCILDFEYKLGAAGNWNRMTVWVSGSQARALVNGKALATQGLPWPLVAGAKKGQLGLQGRKDKAQPYFRYMRICAEPAGK